MQAHWLQHLVSTGAEKVSTDVYQWRRRGAAEGPNWPLRFFRPHELECPLTGALRLHLPTADALERVRIALNVPLVVTSGFRSPEYNRRVGGATGSLHMSGRAFDLKVRDGARHMDLCLAAKDEGFSGFGWYPTFVHIDTGPWRSWAG